MRIFFIILVFCLPCFSASSEVIAEDWLGLWIGETQVGDFPDFSTFSLGDDYILILNSEGSKFVVKGQTHFQQRHYGEMDGIGIVSGEVMTVTEKDCLVELEKNQLEGVGSNRDFLVAQSFDGCGDISTQFYGKFYRFKNSTRK